MRTSKPRQLYLHLNRRWLSKHHQDPIDDDVVGMRTSDPWGCRGLEQSKLDPQKTNNVNVGPDLPKDGPWCNHAWCEHFAYVVPTCGVASTFALLSAHLERALLLCMLLVSMMSTFPPMVLIGRLIFSLPIMIANVASFMLFHGAIKMVRTFTFYNLTNKDMHKFIKVVFIFIKILSYTC